MSDDRLPTKPNRSKSSTKHWKSCRMTKQSEDPRKVALLGIIPITQTAPLKTTRKTLRVQLDCGMPKKSADNEAFMRPISAPFPRSRPRRLRRTPWIRDMVRETRVSPADFIWPLFVCEGEGVEQPIDSMPGVFRYSLDRLVAPVDEAALLGIPCVALFKILLIAPHDTSKPWCLTLA